MRRPRPSDTLVAVGLAILLIGAAVTVAPWLDAARWHASPEAERAQRNAEVPTPIWLNSTPTPVVDASLPVANRSVPARAGPPLTVAALPAATATPAPPLAIEVNIRQAATPTPTRSDLQLTAAAFEFMDPPEPGAAARLTVSVRNPTDRASGPIVLALPVSWLSGYRLQATDPPLTEGSQTETALRLSFGGAEAQSDVDLAVDVVAVDEVIDAPALTVLDADGREVGHARPPTQAPPSRPGPIYSIDIPRLRLHAGVVPVDWEPPLFVIGQVRTSAFVSLGNSVLVGHLRGSAGYNVFDHLDQLEPGDEIIASSRGQPYTFVVSERQVLPEGDTSPTEPTTAPRLTLMTCAGDWDPLSRDYADRLWVVAEPAS